MKIQEIHRPITTIRRILPEGAPSVAAAGSGNSGSGLGAADTVALRQLLQLVTRALAADPANAANAARYGSSSAIGLGIGADDRALGSMLNGATL